MYTFIDLFAGCGGLSEGFLESGFYKPLAHVEWEKPMVNTLRNRLTKKWGFSQKDSQKHVILFDVQKTEELFNGHWSDETIKLYGSDNDTEIINKGLDNLINGKTVDLIIGGPPYNTPRFSDRHNYGGMTNNRYICKKEENQNGKTIEIYSFFQGESRRGSAQGNGATGVAGQEIWRGTLENYRMEERVA